MAAPITPAQLRKLADRSDAGELSEALLSAAQQLEQLAGELGIYRRLHGQSATSSSPRKDRSVAGEKQGNGPIIRVTNRERDE